MSKIANAVRALFTNKLAPLGTKHSRRLLGSFECGVACKYRLKTISCPFFKDNVPCLVGCTLKVVERGGSEMGLDYEEHNFFVLSQSGKYLIGEEQILNLDNPRFARTRIVADKLGNEVLAGGFSEKSLLDFGDFEDNLSGLVSNKITMQNALDSMDTDVIEPHVIDAAEGSENADGQAKA